MLTLEKQKLGKQREAKQKLGKQKAEIDLEKLTRKETTGPRTKTG